MVIRNGVDVDKLKETNEWIKGAHSKTRIQTSSGKTFILEADEPRILLGTDLAPNAVQARYM